MAETRTIVLFATLPPSVQLTARSLASALTDILRWDPEDEEYKIADRWGLTGLEISDQPPEEEGG